MNRLFEIYIYEYWIINCERFETEVVHRSLFVFIMEKDEKR